MQPARRDVLGEKIAHQRHEPRVEAVRGEGQQPECQLSLVTLQLPQSRIRQADFDETAEQPGDPVAGGILGLDPLQLVGLGGRTPIACTNCNTDVKFEPLLRMARQIGAERLATGHYARIRRNEQTARWELLRARDESKDQSYFLWGLSQDQLSSSEFPLGELTKEEVRALARRTSLPVAEKPESMELCFVPTGNYVQFIQAYSKDAGIPLSQAEGEIVTEDGAVVGHHNGVHNFTIGQRKGLGFSAGKPLYVLSIDTQSNRVVVGDDDALRTTSFEVNDVNWVSIEQPSGPIRAAVKIRHKHEPAPAIVEALDDARARIIFDTPQRAITPGQGAVFYDGDRVLGGAWIK